MIYLFLGALLNKYFLKGRKKRKYLSFPKLKKEKERNMKR